MTRLTLTWRQAAQWGHGLADLYVSDPRFTAVYDDIEPGFSQYVHDAMYANAARGQAQPG